MKFIRNQIRLVAIISITILFSCVGIKKSTQNNNLQPKNIVVAHRGAWKKNDLPQNSIASLKQAIALGCIGSEFDVRMTADDSLIINHDETYNNFEIEKTSYAQLAQYKLSNGEKIPTLREYVFAGLNANLVTKLICEIKPSNINKERGKQIAEKVLQLINEMHANTSITYISFDYDILKKINEIDPSAITQYLDGNKSPEQLKADGIKGADYHFSVFKLHPNWIESAKKNGIILNAWTVNSENEMDWLLANNFDFITTNEPELLFEKIQASPIKQGWNLAWSDEFDYDGLPDSTKWAYNVGGNGWGNNELQYYTEADTMNAKVEKGVLKITARKQIKEKNSYTSARLITKGKAEFKYGKIEIRAKLPSGKGTWPALWMLGSNIDKVNWPMCGEIDIMEHVGHQPDSIFGSVHTKDFNHILGTQNTKGLFINNPYTAFHTYSIEWTENKISFYIDGKFYNQFTKVSSAKSKWPFSEPQYIIMNVAIGGNWGGQFGVDENICPATMEVDYVRVYKMN